MAERKTAKKAASAKVTPAKEAIFISEDDRYLFGNGTHYDIYKKLGAHLTEVGGKAGAFFAVWAPHAAAVHVIGSFNDWNEDQYLMERQSDSGIHTLFIKGVKEGDYYKFLIHTPSGEKLYKADPFANYAELRPGTASRIYDLNHYEWKDEKWMKKEIRLKNRWPFTNATSVPGCVIRFRKMTDFTITGNLRIAFSSI